jgi:ATP-binding cassette subfamily B protein
MMMGGGGGGGGMMGGGRGMGGGGGGGGRNINVDEQVFGKVYDTHVIRRLIPYILPYKFLALAALMAVLVYTVSLVAIPWIIAYGVDSFVETGNFTGLVWVFALFIGVAITNWASNYLQQMAIARVGQGILFDLRRQMFVHLQKLSVSFYDKTEVGRIMSRIQGDVWQLQEFMAVVIMTLADLLTLFGIVAMLLIMNWKLGLITMVVLPMLILVMAMWQPYAVKSFLRVRRAISIVNGALNENITGVRVVQSMNRQDTNLKKFDALNSEHRDANFYAGKLAAGLLPPVDILTVVAIGLALFFGARMVSTGELAVGVLIAFLLYIQRFFDPIRNLTMQYTQLQRSTASGMRIFELLDNEPDLVDAPGAKVLPRIKGEIELKNLSFSYISSQNRVGLEESDLRQYEEEGTDVIKNVNLHIKPGETVAIVGPTGAGKTTLVSLISRFYDVPREKGAILVDGYDIRDVTRNSLASQMSMVLQEPFLFSGTVRDNIKYNRGKATDEQMIEAAKAVGAHDFIMNLDDGYDTFLQERGSNLSVGQRQLLSFARAIVADPRILILDEATANIDSYTEMLIQRALLNLLKDRTAIVIAHRLSTIRGADKIVVLNLGEVIEVGTHDELVEKDGLYAHLYRMNYAAIEAPLPLAGDD